MDIHHKQINLLIFKQLKNYSMGPDSSDDVTPVPCVVGYEIFKLFLNSFYRWFGVHAGQVHGDTIDNLGNVKQYDLRFVLLS